MDEISIPNAEDIARATEAATGFMGAIGRLFPGLPMRSIAKAESKITERIRMDVQATKEWGEEIGLSTQSIQLFCNEIYTRNTKTNRLQNVIEFAKDGVKPDVQLNVPEQSWVEAFQEGAEKACDVETQRLWGAILAGELESPGRFSKRTMSILRDMSKAEAEAFKKVCSYSTAKIDSDNAIQQETQTPILKIDENRQSYNHEAISVAEISALQSIGLLSSSMQRGLRLEPGESITLLVAKNNLIAKNPNDDRAIKARLCDVTFEGAGFELASICSIATASNLKELLYEALSKNGFKIEE